MHNDSAYLILIWTRDGYYFLTSSLAKTYNLYRSKIAARTVVARYPDLKAGRILLNT